MTSLICKMTYESVIQIHLSFHCKIECMMPAVQNKYACKQHVNLLCFLDSMIRKIQVKSVKLQMNL